METRWKDRFHFTRSERNGIISLLLLIKVIFVLPHVYSLFVEPKPVDFTAFQTAVDQFYNEEQKVVSSAPLEDTPQKKKTSQPVVLFAFDPNTASLEDLVRLGIKEKTAKTLIKYRTKGGKFRKKEDLKRVYGLKPADYEKLEAYIDIPQKKKEKKKIEPVDIKPESKPSFITKSDEKKTLPKKEQSTQKVTSSKFKARPKITINIDVNAATAEEWQKLRGIGASYSKRIVKFRNALGGFHSIEQISEVYGLPDSTFQSIQPFLKIEDGNIKQININTASREDLKTHPYLKWKQADVIINYREQHGSFETVDDLLKVKVIPPETLEKLKPYIQVD